MGRTKKEQWNSEGKSDMEIAMHYKEEENIKKKKQVEKVDSLQSDVAKFNRVMAFLYGQLKCEMIDKNKLDPKLVDGKGTKGKIYAMMFKKLCDNFDK